MNLKKVHESFEKVCESLKTSPKKGYGFEKKFMDFTKITWKNVRKTKKVHEILNKNVRTDWKWRRKMEKVHGFVNSRIWLNQKKETKTEKRENK